MHTTVIVLNIDPDQTEAFEDGFRSQELPIWEDLHQRGVLARASLTPTEISTHSVEGAVQYMVVAVFHGASGHHEHDSDPRFKAWDEHAEQYQVARPLVFGGDAMLQVGS